jgi:nucleoside-diphosphate-sugar epimerase
MPTPRSIRSIEALTPKELRPFGKILLTGATGRLGSPLLARLSQLGFSVKVVTPDAPPQHPHTEWFPMDFTASSTEFGELLEGVTHVLHLGAELWETETMERINSEATGALVTAAEAAGIKYFCYTSSICVYGSSKKLRVTEDAQLMPLDKPGRKDYMDKDFLIEYARTKLLGEEKIRKSAARCNYVIFRPTEITWEKDILKPTMWSLPTRIWRGRRHCHQVYYKDVMNAIIFFLLRSNEAEAGAVPGKVEVYNLSNDDAPDPRFVDFMKAAWKETRDSRFRTPFAAPLWMDYLKEHIKWKIWTHCFPLGFVYVDPFKLYSTGYQHEYGLAEARRNALNMLRGDDSASL